MSLLPRVSLSDGSGSHAPWVLAAVAHGPHVEPSAVPTGVRGPETRRDPPVPATAAVSCSASSVPLDFSLSFGFAPYASQEPSVQDSLWTSNRLRRRAWAVVDGCGDRDMFFTTMLCSVCGSMRGFVRYPWFERQRKLYPFIRFPPVKPDASTGIHDACVAQPAPPPPFYYHPHHHPRLSRVTPPSHPTSFRSHSTLFPPYPVHVATACVALLPFHTLCVCTHSILHPPPTHAMCATVYRAYKRDLIALLYNTLHSGHFPGGVFLDLQAVVRAITPLPHEHTVESSLLPLSWLRIPFHSWMCSWMCGS